MLAERNWFRQTRVHNTVTLDDRNFDTTDSKLRRWSRFGRVTVVNESYEGFVHKRTFRLRRNGKLIIKDEISGPATGVVGVHFNLLPGEIATETSSKTVEVRTKFDDGNNISVKTTCKKGVTCREDEGWHSPSYREKIARPAYTVQVQKTDAKKIVLTTVIKGI